MRYFEALKNAEKILKDHGVPDADVDARRLLEYASGFGYSRLLLMEREQIPEEILDRYRELTERRERRIPLQQITGEADFMGIRFEVSGKVLTPRQDTETLAEQAILRIREAQKTAGGSEQVHVLDLCTGSGCLIVAAALFCPGIYAVGTDISADALDIARRNVQNSGADVTLLQSDLFRKVEGKYDVILSNPPYIRSGEIGTLMEEVRDHEPHLALDGGPDGLDFYRKIAEKAPGYLKEGGWLLLEIGADQGRDVERILQEHGFADVSVTADLSGLDRVVSGHIC